MVEVGPGIGVSVGGGASVKVGDGVASSTPGGSVGMGSGAAGVPPPDTRMKNKIASTSSELSKNMIGINRYRSIGTFYYYLQLESPNSFDSIFLSQFKMADRSFSKDIFFN